VTSSITWRFDSPYRVSYWCSIGTKSLSPSVFGIFGSKYIGVTSLTFWGHVTSLVMWPFDAPYSISYRRSIVTDSLSPAVFEIFGSKMPVQCKSSLRCAISRDLYPLCKIWVHIWISHFHIAYSLWHFYWAPMKIEGCLLVRPPMLNAKSSQSPDQNWANFGGFGGLEVRGFKKLRFLPQKARPCVKPRLSHFASKVVEWCDLQVGWGKKVRKSQRLP